MSKHWKTFRDGPNTTTTTIIKKTFSIWCHIKTAFDDTSDEKSLRFLCVPLCRRVLKGHLVRHPGVPRKWKMGPREMNSKMVVVVVGPSLKLSIWVYSGLCLLKTCFPSKAKESERDIHKFCCAKCLNTALWGPQKIRRPPDYSSNLCRPKTFATWLLGGVLGLPPVVFLI